METNTIFVIALWLFRMACVSFLFITWRNLKWGIFLICAFLPSYLIRFNFPFNIPGTALELMILILFSIWILKREWKNIDLGFYKNKKLLIGILLFLVFATFSIFISPNFRGAFGIWKAYFIEPLLFIIVFLSVIKKEDIKWIIYSLGFSAFYISIYAIGQKFFGLPIPIPWQVELRATSIFPYPNAVGLFLAPIVFLLLWQILKERSIGLKIFLGIVCVLSISAIIFAQSEGALVALFVGLIFYLFFKSSATKKIAIGLILIIVIASLALSNTVIFEQIKTKLLLQDWSGMVRKTIWSETFEMLKDKPLGVGLNGYQTAIAPYHKSRNWMEIYLYPHNIFLNFWSEIGLIGLLSFIIIISHFYIISRKNPALMIAMTVLLIHGLVDVPYFKNDLSVLFWILIGISLILRKNE